MIKKQLKAFLIFTVVLSLSSGCIFEKKKTKWSPVRQKTKVFLHEVIWADESYELIAKWYTGKKENAELIIDANPTLNPEKLQTGDNVFIPKKILRTRNNFTRKFVDKFIKKPVKKTIRPAKKKQAKTEKETETFELFGPR